MSTFSAMPWLDMKECSCPEDATPVPFDMLKEHRAKMNHGQTLQRLAERGGLSPVEMYAVMKDFGLVETLSSGITQRECYGEVIAEMERMSK